MPNKQIEESITNFQEALENLLDEATDQHLEGALLESLVRKGWIRYDGTISVDLLLLLPTATERAFKDEVFDGFTV